MIYHVLNGDAIAEQFPSRDIAGQQIVIREAFSEGPLDVRLDSAFWEKRLSYLAPAYGATQEDYGRQFLDELKVLDITNAGDKVFLWFEDDLFCLINMLFVIYYLKDKTSVELYRVFPEADNIHWTGFGKSSSADLISYYNGALQVNSEDRALGEDLWKALVQDDPQRLWALAHSETSAYRFLPAVIRAHLDRYPADSAWGRPHQTLSEIIAGGTTDFYEIYEAFWRKESIYGFGDLQVYNMLKEMEIQIGEDI